MIKNISLFSKNFGRNHKLRKDNTNRKLNRDEKIADELGVDYYSDYYLPKVCINDENAFFAYGGLIYFYPPNDGRATKPFSFYKDRDLIFRNDMAYSEIENLDEILLQMVNMYDKALDKKIALNPYSFILRLDDDLEKNYKGKATLVMTDLTVPDNSKSHYKYFLNRFLDHFIGWNFGLSVNRNEELKEALIKLNNKAIDKGIREDAGPGFNVYGLESEVYKGLQHYYLPTTKDNVYTKKK